MALGAMRKIDEMRLRVPEDISVVGFDDIEIASQVSPALTTVAAPVDEIAKRSFGLLLCLMQGVEIENRHVALPASLVTRQTCAKLRKNPAAA